MFYLGRLLVGLGLLIALGYGALYAVATLVEPEPREIVITIPTPKPRS